MEVHLGYPEELHDYHKDYSLAPEKIKVKEEMLSPYSLEIKKENDIKVGICSKLIPNLLLKKNYVVHYGNLKYYLSEGSILKKIHKILKFKQSDWMKPYIEFNTQRRKEPTNETDNTLFKLLNNAAYGKTMENMRKRIKIRITTDEKEFLKLPQDLHILDLKHFDRNLVVIHDKKRTINIK